MANEKNNYELLTDNKQKLLSYIDEIILGKIKPLKVKTSKQMQALLLEQNFGELIMALNQDKDYQLNIIWYINDDLGNGTGALIRDARAQSQDKEKLERDAPQKYMMQLLNKSRGAIDLINLCKISIYEKEVNIQKINNVLEEALKYVDSLSILNIIEYNTQILEILIDLKIKDAPEILQFAREISNFKDVHYHVATLSRVHQESASFDVIEAEIMLCGYTEAQKEQYAKMALYDSVKNNHVGVEWFDQTKSTLKKQLIHQHLHFIKDGNKVTPTQLIYSFMNVRNAYLKVTAIKDNSLKIIAENIHSGTPGVNIPYLPKRVMIDIAKENINQIKTFIGENTDINLSSLNSRTPYDIRGENFTIDQVKSIKKMKFPPFTLTVSPVNKWRLIGGGRRQKAFQKILNIICKLLITHEVLKNKTTNVVKYLQNNDYPISFKLFEIFTYGNYQTVKSKALNEIEILAGSSNAKDIKLSEILKTALSAKEIMSNILPSFENTDLALVNKILLLENSIKLSGGALNDLLSNNLQIKPINNVTFCKSGKDRTGYVMFINTVTSVNNYLNIDKNAQQANQNRKIIAHAGHAQEMAGIQGGTIGCHSLKMMSEFHLDKLDLELRPILAQSSSQLNNKINVIKNSSNKFKAIKEFVLNIFN